MNITILSRNPGLYSTQALVIAARNRGHAVQVVDHMYCDVVIKNGKQDIYYFGRKLEHVHAVIPRIGASATEHGAAVIRQFEAQRVFTAVKAETLLKCRDKLQCIQALAKAGLNVPDSIAPNRFDYLEEVGHLLGNREQVVKLLISTQGLGVLLAESPKKASALVEAFSRLKQSVMVQEFVKEANGEDIRAFVVDNDIVGVMVRKAKEGEFRSNLHRGAQAFLTKLSHEEEVLVKKAANTMNLPIAGVDVLRSSKGPMILEINASPGLEGIEGVTKVNIAEKIIQYVERGARKFYKEDGQL